jgi:type IV pilus assembly protein PilY1
VGLLGSFVVVDDPASSSVTRYDSSGQAVRTVFKRSLQVGSTGAAEGRSIPVQEVVGRLSWRQIYNYQELRKKATSP